MTKEQILQEASALQEEIKAHRLWLHTHAETGFDLTETKPYVKSALTEMGYAVHECGKAGLVTTVGKPGGKVLLLRADMDALPIAEEADVDFACKNGRMHACGHDWQRFGTDVLAELEILEVAQTARLVVTPDVGRRFSGFQRADGLFPMIDVVHPVPMCQTSAGEADETRTDVGNGLRQVGAKPVLPSLERLLREQ